MSIRRVLRSVGIALLAAGVLVMLFVAYELWGTGLTTASHQNALRQQFDRELRAHHVAAGPTTTVPQGTGTTTTTTQPITAVQPAEPPAASGQPVGIINIPKIGINYVAVQGTDEPDLERGPGHYVNTALPGNPGNAAFAGHRTTYAAPFYNLDQLAPGDPIYVTTTQGRFQYDVTKTQVVDPTRRGRARRHLHAHAHSDHVQPALQRGDAHGGHGLPGVARRPRCPGGKAPRDHREQGRTVDRAARLGRRLVGGHLVGASPVPPWRWPSGWCTVVSGTGGCTGPAQWDSWSCCSTSSVSSARCFPPVTDPLELGRPGQGDELVDQPGDLLGRGAVLAGGPTHRVGHVVLVGLAQ